jgi:hypothetical protein
MSSSPAVSAVRIRGAGDARQCGGRTSGLHDERVLDQVVESRGEELGEGRAATPAGTAGIGWSRIVTP